ncbi:MAG: UbiA family prenyltransferase, partial [Balneolales bacterium]|nr:UbiA family prenyltransferase [Balneolales bacterium]
TGTLNDPGMWVLFLIVFLWQIPHVMAIAWMYKEDYAGAGFKMLPKNDDTGLKTATYSIITILLLVPVTYFLFALDQAGLFFLIAGTSLAFFFLHFGVRFAIERTREAARKLMFASIAYLPIIWLVLSVDRLF